MTEVMQNDINWMTISISENELGSKTMLMQYAIFISNVKRKV